MSKKDYQAVAKAIYAARTVKADEVEALDGIAEVTVRLAGVLAADNPRFDRARFLEACETGACRGMRPESVGRRAAESVARNREALPPCVRGHARGAGGGCAL